MTWPALFGVFLLSHLVGDFLLQTSWQATSKAHGLVENGEARKALATHALVYTLGFIPALVWIGVEVNAGVAAGIGVLVFASHMIIDDGTIVASWVRHIKHVEGAPTVVVRLGVDQTLHLLVLGGLALLATG